MTAPVGDSLFRAAMIEQERDRTKRRLREIQHYARPDCPEVNAYLQIAEVVIRYLDLLELGSAYPSPPPEFMDHLKYAQDSMRMVVGWPSR